MINHDHIASMGSNKTDRSVPSNPTYTAQLSALFFLTCGLYAEMTLGSLAENIKMKWKIKKEEDVQHQGLKVVRKGKGGSPRTRKESMALFQLTKVLCSFFGTVFLYRKYSW